MGKKKDTESVVRAIRRKTRKHYSSEEKIGIVLEGLRGEDSIASICRREGINPNLYYRWSKDFLEAGSDQDGGEVVVISQKDACRVGYKSKYVLRLVWSLFGGWL